MTMKCVTVKTQETLKCSDVNQIKYCKIVKQEEKICVPDGENAFRRLLDVLRGIKK